MRTHPIARQALRRRRRKCPVKSPAWPAANLSELIEWELDLGAVDSAVTEDRPETAQA
jgi:hypothetical protein